MIAGKDEYANHFWTELVALTEISTRSAHCTETFTPGCSLCDSGAHFFCCLCCRLKSLLVGEGYNGIVCVLNMIFLKAEILLLNQKDYIKKSLAKYDLHTANS
jgi:hypothetical protein